MSISSANNEQQRFNQWSETYERSFMQWLIFDRVHRKVLSSLPPDFNPDSILDIGCGTGRLLRRMHARWPAAKLVGIDLAEGMVSKAHQLTPTATIYQAPSENIPLKDGSADLITTTMSFHHWSNHAQGVGEAVRILRSSAYFVLADTNIGHGHPLSRAQVRDLLQASGFILYSQKSLVPYLTITVAKKA
jgi:ubiquinone/menaquinone biosynthesis C-methylase UbiE